MIWEAQNTYTSYYILFYCFFSFVACGPSPRQRLAATLADVESYINDRPDSALAVLESVDSSALTSRALRARYSLLRTMAQAKNYRDLTVPGLIDDAALWYEHHGSPDEKMKTLYYQGCIAQANKDQNNAAIFYSRAEQFAEKATDKHAVGLLFEAMASVYNTVYNTAKEQEYAEKALATFSEANDPIYGSALGVLAFVYHSRKDWSKADSLYQRAIDNSESYPHALSLYLSNYARMKVLQPDEDPEGSIALLDRKQELTGNLTPQEAGAYAYSLSLLGNTSASESLRVRLESLTERARYDVLPWLARMAVLSGDYTSAYRYQVEMHAKEESIIEETLTDSVSQTLEEYYAQAAKKERERKLRQGFWAMGIITLLLVLSFILYIRKRRFQTERNRLISIRSVLEDELREQTNQSEALFSDLSSRLGQLRSQLQQERLSRLRKSGRYGYWAWMSENQRLSDREVVRSLRKDLQDVCVLEKDYNKLADRLDRELEGLYSKLKADLRMVGRPEEERFLCYWLIKLKPDMIAELMGITTNNVYVKTYRLEDRIRNLDKPEYLCLIEA